MSTIYLNSVITRDEEIVTAVMDSEIVMMSIETGKYYNLGNMGSVIWGILESSITVEALIGRLLEQYDVSWKQCEKEVLAFLEDTVKNGLVRVTVNC